jgi:predicted ATPase
MKLESLQAVRFRSLRDETIGLTDLNLFIGANASGKSTILDALRFLHEGMQERDFRSPVFSRGGIVHLAWKGEEARQIALTVRVQGDTETYEWAIVLRKEGYEFAVKEDLYRFRRAEPRSQLLSSDKGRAEFVSRWGFFDPNPFLLRRDWTGLDSSKFDPYGRNLAERLYFLSKSSPEIFKQIVSATQSVLGLPSGIEPRESEDRFNFVQSEPGLRYSVHQMGVSSGTLRMLALMTALFSESGNNLIGIEEPENNVHPTALTSFAEYLLKVRDRVQILVTTHSPLLLDFLSEPEAVCIVRHTDQEGTRVTRENNAPAVRQALEASGFGLGEYYETKGFGG